MAFFGRTIDATKEVERLNRRLQQVLNLKTTIETVGWREIETIFREEIGVFTQQVFDLSGDPTKNDAQIRLAHSMAQSLSRILGTIDVKVQSAETINRQITEHGAMTAHKQE